MVEDGPARERLDRLPLLCVEVLSPGTRRHDLVLKRRAYERAGVRSYWIVDPTRPSLTVLGWQEGRYVEVACVERDQPWTAALPYDVTIVPDDLLR